MNHQTKENVLFISGIDTNVGKTVATGMIAKALAKAGKKVITQKMIQTGYEPYYLNRVFKTEVGISPKQYYRDLKMHYAARMLLESEISIADAAEYLHYSSYTHFCSDFKAVMNCTPTDYRRSHR